MFGHEKGSFTGAIGTRAGMFQLAHGGTILLDEISEMSPVLQVKLLRVLQDREVRPVGADSAFKVDVRVIAATNKDLALQVERGLFREDLYYRLEVIPITLPPLRDRRSDIPMLVKHFLDRHNQKRRDLQVTITDETMVHLWEYDWPGNVRELENLLERLVILSEDGVVGIENLPSNIRSVISEKKIPRPAMTEEGLDLTNAVEEFENRLIEEALRRTKGHKPQAARLLGLSASGLVAKMEHRKLATVSTLPGTHEPALEEMREAFEREVINERLSRYKTLREAAISLGLTRTGLYKKMLRLFPSPQTAEPRNRTGT